MSPSHEKNPNPTHVSHGNALEVQSKYFDRYPEQVTDSENDLCNFYLKLPIKANREMYEPILGVKESQNGLRSSLRVEQTLGEFLAVIDEEISRIGMDDILKLYRALRARGYTHYDLVG